MLPPLKVYMKEKGIFWEITGLPHGSWIKTVQGLNTDASAKGNGWDVTGSFCKNHYGIAEKEQALCVGISLGKLKQYLALQVQSSSMETLLFTHDEHHTIQCNNLRLIAHQYPSVSPMTVMESCPYLASLSKNFGTAALWLYYHLYMRKEDKIRTSVLAPRVIKLDI